MAGHSKWANIKHRKARVDAQRGKIWGKCSRAIMVAVRAGGPDPDANLNLRYAIEEAKAVNMPKDNIERAIKRATGDTGGGEFEHARYEGYGPGGVAIMIDALTDNRNRTVSDVRAAFTKHDGNLGETGCVGYLFDARGIITIEQDNAPAEDRLIELAAEAGADDVAYDDGVWTVSTPPADLLDARDALQDAGVSCASAEVMMIPGNTIPVSGQTAAKVMRLIETLEDHDDVQKVYANYDIPEEEWTALQQA